MECTNDETTQYLAGHQVRKRYGISEQSLWRWLRNESLGFPKPIYINRIRYWTLCELVEWERSRRRGNVMQRAA
jgi:predicted DNA-binding transcriptional regulator AlpA